GFDAGTDLIEGVSEDGVDHCMALMTSAESGVRPQAATVDAVVELCQQAVALAAQPASPPWRTLAAIAAWWSGDDVTAQSEVGEALAVDPDYRLALLMQEALIRDVAPGWMRHSG